MKQCFFFFHWKKCGVGVDNVCKARCTVIASVMKQGVGLWESRRRCVWDPPGAVCGGSGRRCANLPRDDGKRPPGEVGALYGGRGKKDMVACAGSLNDSHIFFVCSIYQI